MAESDSQCAARFFVFGPERSGTTLLAFLLSGQPDTFVVNDSFVFDRFAEWALLRSPRAGAHPGARIVITNVNHQTPHPAVAITIDATQVRCLRRTAVRTRHCFLNGRAIHLSCLSYAPPPNPTRPSPPPIPANS